MAVDNKTLVLVTQRSAGFFSLIQALGELHRMAGAAWCWAEVSGSCHPGVMREEIIRDLVPASTNHTVACTYPGTSVVE